MDSSEQLPVAPDQEPAPHRSSSRPRLRLCLMLGLGLPAVVALALLVRVVSELAVFFVALPFLFLSGLSDNPATYEQMESQWHWLARIVSGAAGLIVFLAGGRVVWEAAWTEDGTWQPQSRGARHASRRRSRSTREGSGNEA